MQPYISEKLDSFPDKLTNEKQLQRFLRCGNYGSRFLKNAAELQKPLQQLLKKNAKFLWKEEHTRAVQILKE